MQAAQRVRTRTRQPSQRQPATRPASGTQRRVGHGLGDDGSTRKISGRASQFGGQAIGLEASDRAGQLQGLAQQSGGLTQRSTRARRLPRNPLGLTRQVLSERAHAFTRRRRHRENLSLRCTALIQQTTQVLHDRIALRHGDGIDVREDNRHRSVRRAQARQPLVMKTRIRVLLWIDDNNECVDARCQTIGNLRVAGLDRINVRQIDDDGVARERLRRLHPTTDAQPPQQFLRFSASRQHGARFIRRGASNASSNNLSPAERIHQRGLASARASQHADDTPGRVDLAAFGRHVNELANTRQGLLIKIPSSQGAHLVELLGGRRHGVRRPPHASTSRALSTAAASLSTRPLSEAWSRLALTGATTSDSDSPARRSSAARACSANERTVRSPK